MNVAIALQDVEIDADHHPFINNWFNRIVLLKCLQNTANHQDSGLSFVTSRAVQLDTKEYGPNANNGLSRPCDSFSTPHSNALLPPKSLKVYTASPKTPSKSLSLLWDSFSPSRLFDSSSDTFHGDCNGSYLTSTSSKNSDRTSLNFLVSSSMPPYFESSLTPNTTQSQSSWREPSDREKSDRFLARKKDRDSLHPNIISNHDDVIAERLTPPEKPPRRKIMFDESFSIKPQANSKHVSPRLSGSPA